jgi:hypothetical protein
MGPALSTFLRKFPSVMLAWCVQVGAASRACRNMVSGRMVRLPSVNDVFVCDNGQLIVGNTAFEPLEEGPGCDDNGDSRNIGSGGVEAEPDLSHFFLDLLASVLSLSRRTNMTLAPSLYNADNAEDNNNRNDDDDDDAGSADAAARRLDAHEEVISVIEGSELEVVFGGHSSRGVQVINTLGGAADSTLNKSNLQVRILFYVPPSFSCICICLSLSLSLSIYYCLSAFSDTT